ncbi:MAG: phosphoribosylformylglycinamidine synthase I [Planctomycetota bacterium]|jgi:phosphoribosylformylglycinamidine synthase
METPRALVLRAAGTNCDRETAVAAEKGGFAAEILHVNRLVESPDLLGGFHFLVVPGGFSYGDDLGAGRVFANELRVKLGGPLREFVRAGRLVLGICNGFQVLVLSGLLPDPFSKDTSSPVTLTVNDSGRYEDRWVYLKVSSQKSEFVREGALVELPVAHGEGKFLPRDERVLESLREEGQLVLRYVGPDGRQAGHPWNPNGSVEDVAGICDPTGRVLGLMPHPERFQDSTNHPQWTRRGKEIPPDGLEFFRNACAYVKRALL